MTIGLNKMLITIVSWSLVVSIGHSHLNLYYTDRMNDGDLQHDCLPYYVLDNIVNYVSESTNTYQSILYCIRPGADDSDLSYSTVGKGTSISFFDMRKQKLSSQQLFSWFAPIDVSERYQEYLDDPTRSNGSELFTNCSLLWFGEFCQFTFNTSKNFSDIVRDHFFLDKIDTELITNRSCYIHLPCNHTLPSYCLDWREICDGNIDCIGGQDEIGCFELELNECAVNEYRCHHRSHCISAGFLRDDELNSECSDGTDEIRSFVVSSKYPSNCYRDPAFRCEERICQKTTEFACGDGHCVNYMPSGPVASCRYNRILLNTHLFPFASDPNFSDFCQHVVWCIIRLSMPSQYDQCCLNQSCSAILENCPISFILHLYYRPLSHVKLIYKTNRNELITAWLPEFVCYNKQSCHFLPPTVNISGLFCRHIDELNVFSLNISLSFNLKNFLDKMIILFKNCSSMDLKTNNKHCQNTHLYQCAHSAKCISKHRLLDGIIDCFEGDDELYNQSCSLNDRYRFQCLSEPPKCISPLLIDVRKMNCSGIDYYIDPELRARSDRNIFRDFCDGLVTRFTDFEEGKKDEMNCDLWPCANQYTICNGVWNCANGADELNCSSSPCSDNDHPCVSPITFNMTCLSLFRANDGIIDCLGSSDERQYCRETDTVSSLQRYRCWNHSECISIDLLCNNRPDCPYGDDERFCEGYPILFYPRCHKYWAGNRSISEDYLCNLSDSMPKISFSLTNNIEYPTVRRTHTNNSIALQAIHKHDDLFAHLPMTKTLNVNHWLLFCNRGILVREDNLSTPTCFCPPSYYGNRCQFQNQRISLTLRFQAENKRTIYHIVIKLIDEHNIHSYEHITYAPMRDCRTKYNIYLLYDERPKNPAKHYTIHVDVFNKIDLSHLFSWYISIPFQFLPVNRIASQVTILEHRIETSKDCSLNCGLNGKCKIYANINKQFCQCFTGWTGSQCSIHFECNCSPDSICIGSIRNRSICVCPLNKFGSRCFLTQVACQSDPCLNDGLCITDDEYKSQTNFTCLCKEAFYGRRCEYVQTRIDITFARQMVIPHGIIGHFITVFNDKEPIRITVFKRIRFGQESVTFYRSIPFHILLTNFSNNLYLTVIHKTFIPSSNISTQINPSHRCAPIHEVFPAIYMNLQRLDRAKYFHVPCQKRTELVCFYDEMFFCLCNLDHHANCFHFSHRLIYTCQDADYCQNGAQCFQDDPNCPNAMICACPDCFFGSRCHLTTRGFGLSLDAILAYQIYPNISFSRQPAAVKVSVALTTCIFVVGIVNFVLSFLTFRGKVPQEVGCGMYLLASAIVSLITINILALKTLFLILSHMTLITDRTFLTANCVIGDYLLNIFLRLVEWFYACVAIERAWTLSRGANFDKAKTKRVAKWIILLIILWTCTSNLQDSIHRHLMYDEDQQRTWCIARYSTSLQIFHLSMNLVHFLVPFSINIISAIYVICVIARQRFTVHKQKSYKEYLIEQYRQHKHLLISSWTILILTLPRVIISFVSGCMKSAQDPWLFLIGYFVSFIPSVLTFIIFVIPSQVYMKEFQEVIKLIHRAIRRRLHLE